MIIYVHPAIVLLSLGLWGFRAGTRRWDGLRHRPHPPAASLWVSWRTASGLWQGGFQEESNLRTRENLDRLANLVQHMKPVVEPDEPIEEQKAWIFARMASAFTYELRRTGPPS